ncbi:major facilitator superfamily domain-containing protein 6-like [Paramacrobiotus metropolitanus]|uniref:major facilitator superfamily domain-containing protein 6-like n=1 Tax=Paramacrobiotus metropolitanus TaxID=2943436 RepID=UPI0024460E21|nr:major facilitator superfamily domain-containing protein 6-like [Paramacrobiotus metropolitanus]
MSESLRNHVKAFFHPYLLSLKTLYFFQLGAQSCLVPYVPLYIKHLGLNASENGIIFGSLPFVSMLAKPVTGALSDKFKAPYALARIFSLMQLAFFISVYFVPSMNVLHPIHNITCHTSNTAYYDSSNLGNFTCINLIDNSTFSAQVPTANISSYVADQCDLNCSWIPPLETTADGISIRWTLQFWLSGLLLIFAWYGYASVVTLDDSIAFGIVNSAPVPTTYGANRVLGTMGWAIGALAVGFLLDEFSDTSPQDRDFTPAFIAFAVAAVLGVASTLFLPKQILVENEKLLLSVTKSVFTFEVLLFCAGTFVAGINSGLLYGYLAWYQSDLGATNLLLGITVFVQCCYEAPMMAVSGWIIKKIGYHGCMLLCLVSFGIRFLAYGLIVDPWFVLLIDIVHSVGFGLSYAAMTNFAFAKAPVGGTATLQGILGSTYEGIGQGIGGIAAGLFYQQYGARATWLGYSVFSFTASIFYAIFSFIHSRSAKKSADLQTLAVSLQSMDFNQKP